MNQDIVALTIELRLLVYAAFICLLLWLPYILAGIMSHGLMPMLGYGASREEGVPAWAKRAYRAHLNLVENLAPFAVLVLVAHVSNVHSDLTVWGAQVFFWARVVQILVTWGGVPIVRTLAFAVGWVGNLMIFAALMGA
ncbi:MAG: MAPEG family protein [Alphaproteobacteria bacterium]